MEAANEQTAALSRLLVVVENYPKLKSNETFDRLMDELAGTENRIAVERMRYNEDVQEYNTSRRAVPGQHHGRHFRLQGDTRSSRRPSPPNRSPRSISSGPDTIRSQESGVRN